MWWVSDSGLGHIPRLWVLFLVQVGTIPHPAKYRRQPIDASLLHQCFSLFLPLSLKAMKKNVLGWRLKKKSVFLSKRHCYLISSLWLTKFQGNRRCRKGFIEIKHSIRTIMIQGCYNRVDDWSTEKHNFHKARKLKVDILLSKSGTIHIFDLAGIYFHSRTKITFKWCKLHAVKE